MESSSHAVVILPAPGRPVLPAHCRGEREEGDGKRAPAGKETRVVHRGELDRRARLPETKRPVLRWITEVEGELGKTALGQPEEWSGTTSPAQRAAPDKGALGKAQQCEWHERINASQGRIGPRAELRKKIVEYAA
jgi:hypothetical protein